ncbi:MAG TPA: hypothetical protein VME44_26635 [Streptosporangiaceae bacterium]|nr:hypothetical protein [Streptosporangiaceae bacterium]
MDNVELGPANAPGQTAPAARPGRVKRVVTTIAAGVILLGSGAAIGVALTSGASAATSPPHSGTAGPAAAKCAKIVKALRAHPAFASSHPAVSRRVRAFCTNPLVRLAAVGGEYGQVTFKGKTSPKTAAFERGTIESVTGSSFTVQAADGTTWTWDLIASTKMREAGDPSAQVKLTSGDRVLVIGLETTTAKDARLIQVRPAS